MNNNLINKLQISGLTKREAHIYLALLQKKEFTIAEIASIVPIGRTKIYDVMPGLVAGGFCNEMQKNGKKIYSAVEPEIVLKKILENSQQDLENLFLQKEQMLVNKISAINELQNVLGKIYLSNSGKSGNVDYIEVLNDTYQIKDKWLALQKNVQKEILVFTKAPYILKLSENVKPEKSALKKKIVIKALYEYYNITPENRMDFINMLNTFTGIGEKIKIIYSLPMKLAIFDEKVTMLALNDPVSLEPSVTTMIVNHPSFALSLKKVFESYWTSSISIKDYKKIEHIK